MWFSMAEIVRHLEVGGIGNFDGDLRRGASENTLILLSYVPFSA
jgi:hypothetical protein